MFRFATSVPLTTAQRAEAKRIAFPSSQGAGAPTFPETNVVVAPLISPSANVGDVVFTFSGSAALRLIQNLSDSVDADAAFFSSQTGPTVTLPSALPATCVASNSLANSGALVSFALLAVALTAIIV